MFGKYHIDIGIVGRTGSGKTTFLAVLCHKLTNDGSRAEGVALIPDPKAQQELSAAYALIESGKDVDATDPTQTPLNFKMSFRKKNGRVLGTVSLHDYAGEKIDPENVGPLLRKLKKKDSLMFLIPPEAFSKKNQEHETVNTFMSLFDGLTRARRWDWLRPAPRITLVPTKADELKRMFPSRFYETMADEGLLRAECPAFTTLKANTRKSDWEEIFYSSALGFDYIKGAATTSKTAVEPHLVVESFEAAVSKGRAHRRRRVRRRVAACILVISSAIAGLYSYLENLDNRLRSRVAKRESEVQATLANRDLRRYLEATDKLSQAVTAYGAPWYTPFQEERLPQVRQSLETAKSNLRENIPEFWNAEISRSTVDPLAQYDQMYSMLSLEPALLEMLRKSSARDMAAFALARNNDLPENTVEEIDLKLDNLRRVRTQNPSTAELLAEQPKALVSKRDDIQRANRSKLAYEGFQAEPERTIAEIRKKVVGADRVKTNYPELSRSLSEEVKRLQNKVVDIRLAEFRELPENSLESLRDKSSQALRVYEELPRTGQQISRELRRLQKYEQNILKDLDAIQATDLYSDYERRIEIRRIFARNHPELKETDALLKQLATLYGQWDAALYRSIAKAFEQRSAGFIEDTLEECEKYLLGERENRNNLHGVLQFKAWVDDLRTSKTRSVRIVEIYLPASQVADGGSRSSKVDVYVSGARGKGISSVNIKLDRQRRAYNVGKGYLNYRLGDSIRATLVGRHFFNTEASQVVTGETALLCLLGRYTINFEGILGTYIRLELDSQDIFTFPPLVQLDEE